MYPKKKLDKFNEILKELFYLTCEYGIERCKPLKDDTLQQIRFYQYVHEGWKKAQNLAIKTLFDIQDEVSEIKKKIKHHNEKHHTAHAKELKDAINLLEGRRRKIQFAINAIVWTILNNQHHIIRRFFLRDDIFNLEKHTLFKTLEFVDEENKDPNKCAICCDLTTFMHIGDVLTIDLSEKKKTITLIELKEGKINEKCQDILGQYYQTECPRNLYLNTRNLERTTIDQLKRMARQEWRCAQALSAINEGEGIDISTEEKIKIPDEEYIIETYEQIIWEMFNELSDNNTWSIRDVDKCLFLGLYTDRRLAEGAFHTWMQGIGVDSPVWDYRNVFSFALARPPFTLLFPPDLIKSLVTGQIVLKMCLHVPYWMKMLNSAYQGANVELETLKKSRKSDLKPGDLFKYKNQLIKFETSNISGHVGSGILSKILFDFYRPVDSMRPIITTCINKINPADS